LGVRFGRDAQPGEDPLSAGGRYAIESYLDHHADKLSHRFDPNSYLVLTRAMNHHDIGRDRGGWQSALQRVTGELVVAGVTTDRLYPLHLSEEMAHAREGTAFEVIVSDHGHDGFLVERASVGALIRRALGPS
jgi:homoserine O-acetyltransferase